MTRSSSSSAQPSAQIVVIGSINADLTVTVARHPAPGETLLGSGGSVTPGGKGANQAVAAARLGSRVAMIGAVGTVGSPAHAADAVALLDDAGVDLGGVAEADAVTGLAVITVDEDGENTIVVVPGANTAVTAELIDARSDVISAAEVVLLQGEIPAAGFARAIEHACGRVVVNLAPVIEVDHAALLRADPLVVNEHEAELVLTQFGVTAAHTPEAQADALRRAGFASVVITLGARGVIVANADATIHVASPKVTAVDSVGAGDAFTGALCHALVAGHGLARAAGYAARVGAYSVTKPGAQPSYPWADEPLP